MPLYNARGNINVTVNDTSLPFGIYAADGSLRVKVVSGTSFVGLYAPDGAYNVVSVAGTDAPAGVYHSSGALRATAANASTIGAKSPSGSIYMNGLLIVYSFVADAGTYSVQALNTTFLYSRLIEAGVNNYQVVGTDATVSTTSIGPPALGAWDRALEDNWARILENGDERVTEDFTNDVITNLSVTPLTGGTSVDIAQDCSASSGIYYGGIYLDTATEPSAEQLEAGTDGDDNPLVWSTTFDLSSITDVAYGPTTLVQTTGYKYSAVVRRSATVGDYSNVATDAFTTFDAAPILSNILVFGKSNTTAVASVTTDDPTGSLKYGIFPAASTPTKSNILNGTGGAVAYGSKSASSIGVLGLPNITGLAASTEYKIHGYQVDGTAQESSIITSSSFWTPPAKSTRFQVAHDGTTTGTLTALTATTAQTDPLGGSNAIKYTANPTGSAINTNIGRNFDFGTYSQIQMYIKKGVWASSAAWIRFRITNTDTTPLINFNIDDGSTASVSSRITNFLWIPLDNDWKFVTFDVSLYVDGTDDTNGTANFNLASSGTVATVATSGEHSIWLYDYKNVY